MTYIGEHLYLQFWGNFFIVLSVAASALAATAYFFSFKSPDHNWKNLARISFRLQVLGVLGTAGILFWILIHHYYEFSYCWKHASNSMQLRYVFACFWSDQEGSFLLWSFWHCMIGIILQRSAKEYESGVMSLLSVIQFFLGTMLLGVFVFGTKIGTNPFILLRENPDFANIPLFKNPNYLEHLDGRGLNPLLQNYWMTIHPPTLFLGFALTVVPFIYALTGLWKKDFLGWQKPLLPWAFTGVMVLGTGILMGGAWAYEALSFGGFWAWDPVENASLVPWLTLVGAAHLLLVNKNKGNSIFSSTLLSIASFILVLYSTFLTRSGILGNSSVHSFTDLGMQKQLLLFLLVFVALAVYLLQSKKIFGKFYLGLSVILFVLSFSFNFYPSICMIIFGIATLKMLFVTYFTGFPKDIKEESLFSREFWLFTGALLFFLSAVTISIFTSIPIFNKMFQMNKAPFSATKFNDWEIPFAMLLALLVSVGQFLKYKNTEKSALIKNLWPSALFGFIFGTAAAGAMYYSNCWTEGENNTGIRKLEYWILLCTSAFALFANGKYWLFHLKGKMKGAGASVAHIGFAILLAGALISTSGKKTLSRNTSGKNVTGLGKEFTNKKNIFLAMGDTLPMGPYFISYTGRTKAGVNMNFRIAYFSKTDGKYIPCFELFPRVQLNEKMGNTAEPDTRHFLSHDIYTHVSYADPLNESSTAGSNEYEDPENHIIHRSDSLFSSNAIIILDSVFLNKSKKEYELNPEHTMVTAVLAAHTTDRKVCFAYPKFSLDSTRITPISDSIPKLGLRFSLWNIHPQEGTFEILMSEKKSNKKDFLVMEAYMFPYINILWIGCLVMAIGSGMAVWERIRVPRNG